MQQDDLLGAGQAPRGHAAGALLQRNLLVVAVHCLLDVDLQAVRCGAGGTARQQYKAWVVVMVMLVVVVVQPATALEPPARPLPKPAP